jgi:hypothetical protein
MATETIKTPTPPVGVIESLSRGFETVAGYPALLILPILLDLVLWVGPRVSFAPAINSVREQAGCETIAEPTDAEKLNWWDQLLCEGLESPVDQYFPLLVVPTDFGQVMEVIFALSAPQSGLVQARVQSIPFIGVPSTFAAREATGLPFGYLPPVWAIATMPGVLGIKLLAFVLQLLLGTVYLLLIASRVAGKPINFAAIARLPIVILQIMILGFVLQILLLIVLVPFILLAGGSTLISEFLANMVLITGLLIGLWSSLFVVFPVHGMLLNRRNILGALWDSFRVVQWNLSSSMMLMLIIASLNLALGYLWTLSDMGSWIALLAAGGNAFFSTGLIAATFVFYQDRYRYWREMREALLAELQRRRAQDHTGV